MLDFTEGWAWFVAGLSATVAIVLFLLAIVGLARRSQERPRGHK